LPEITLGIAPGIGAMVVPYRRWPQAAGLFHGMLRDAERLPAARAHEAGIVAALADDYSSLIQKALLQVQALAGRKRPPLDGAVAIAPFPAGKGRFNAEVTAIIEEAVRAAAAAATLAEALEIGYQAFGSSACTSAAREGISAFLGAGR
jgi:enoyl-CoA hydratase/3-hydroxyacyl-CoA dehydrogenase